MDSAIVDVHFKSGGRRSTSSTSDIGQPQVIWYISDEVRWSWGVRPRPRSRNRANLVQSLPQSNSEIQICVLWINTDVSCGQPLGDLVIHTHSFSRWKVLQKLYQKTKMLNQNEGEGVTTKPLIGRMPCYSITIGGCSLWALHSCLRLSR